MRLLFDCCFELVCVLCSEFGVQNKNRKNVIVVVQYHHRCRLLLCIDISYSGFFSLFDKTKTRMDNVLWGMMVIE